MRKLLYSLLFLILAGCSQTMGMQSGSSDQQESGDGQEDAQTETAEGQETDVPLESRSSPVIEDPKYNVIPEKITLESIGVESAVVPVGLLENGEMAVPEDFKKTGWFDLGTNPGNRGSSVIAGHVDDPTGEGVFYSLKDLKPGDEVQVSGDGETLTFEVVDSQVFPQDEAPIDDIFGYTSRRMLNLITCIGDYDVENGGRTERLVVYTELVEE